MKRWGKVVGGVVALVVVAVVGMAVWNSKWARAKRAALYLTATIPTNATWVDMARAVGVADPTAWQPLATWYYGGDPSGAAAPTMTPRDWKTFPV